MLIFDFTLTLPFTTHELDVSSVYQADYRIFRNGAGAVLVSVQLHGNIIVADFSSIRVTASLTVDPDHLASMMTIFHSSEVQKSPLCNVDDT